MTGLVHSCLFYIISVLHMDSGVLSHGIESNSFQLVWELHSCFENQIELCLFVYEIIFANLQSNALGLLQTTILGGVGHVYTLSPMVF